MYKSIYIHTLEIFGVFFYGLLTFTSGHLKSAVISLRYGHLQVSICRRTCLWTLALVSIQNFAYGQSRRGFVRWTILRHLRYIHAYLASLCVAEYKLHARLSMNIRYKGIIGVSMFKTSSHGHSMCCFCLCESSLGKFE
jgi:hypothetical protein